MIFSLSLHFSVGSCLCLCVCVRLCDKFADNLCLSITQWKPMASLVTNSVILKINFIFSLVDDFALI